MVSPEFAGICPELRNYRNYPGITGITELFLIFYFRCRQI
jgi:hypothetical protein